MTTKKNKNKKVHTVYVDGGAYNNGKANQKARVCVVHENEVIIHEDIGNHTSNEAEFIAIEKAFDWISKNIDKNDVVVVFSDSKLAVNMVKYIWQGQIQRIKDLRDKVANKLPENTIINWIYRDFNKAGILLEFNLPRV
jgi:ribonuclease HI